MSGTDGQPRWLTDEEQQAWRATVHMSQLLMRQLDHDLAQHGLNGRDYEILVELSEAPEHRLRMTDLADATSQSTKPAVAPDLAHGKARPGPA